MMKSDRVFTVERDEWADNLVRQAKMSILDEAISRLDRREEAPGTSIEEARGLAIAEDILHMLKDEC